MGESKWRMETDFDDYLILAGGLVSTVLTIVLANLLLRWDFALISFLLWFIIPAGAMVLGAGSAAGFFIVARLKQKRLSVVPACLMMLILVPAYFGHYYSVYRDYKVETEYGDIVPLSRVAGFWEFYKADITGRSYSTQYESHDAEKKPVGNWGYFYVFLELMGFLLGGIFALFYFARLDYCENCSRYFTNTPVGFSAEDTAARETGEALLAKDEFAVRKSLAGWQRKWPGKPGLVFTLYVNRCKGCYGDSKVKITGSKIGSTEKKDVAEGSVTDVLAKDILEHFSIK